MTDSEAMPEDMSFGSRVICAAEIQSTLRGGDADSADFSSFRWATNIGTSVLDIIRPIVLGENVTIVTGYASLLSVLSLVVSLRPGITFAERGTVRIVLGEEDRPAGRSPYPAPLTPARLKAIFLHPAGVAMSDPRDVRAAMARDALSKGAIRIRVVDATRLAAGITGLQANMIVGEDFAVLSSGGFSRRDLHERAVVADRVANDTPAYEARQETAESLWQVGQNCTYEVGEIIDALFAPVDPRIAMRRAIDVMQNFPLFEVRGGEVSPIHAELVSQALARTYENGFAFVRVPAGAGQSDIAAAIDRRLAFNAERMIGQPGMKPWCAHVGTSTGARWPDTRILRILAEEAPLALDGSVAPRDGESEVAALYRRLKCRHVPRRGQAATSRDFEGYPEIETQVVRIDPTKSQSAARERVLQEISNARNAALDPSSAAELETLSSLVCQLGEAALLAWRQGGMNMRVRMSARGDVPGSVDQNYLPMFGDDIPEPEPNDTLGEALAARGFRGLDKSRLSRIVEWNEPTLILAEDGLVRHAIARRMSEMIEEPVLGIVGEDILRKAGISGRDTPYQRADTTEVAMSILSGAEEGGPRIVVAAADQAAELTLSRVTSCLVLSAPGNAIDLAAALSSIDGIGKEARRIRIACFSPLEPSPCAADPSLFAIADILKTAVRQMRTPIEDVHDGVADILAGLEQSLNEEGEHDLETPLGRIALATVGARVPFTLFALAGVASEADSAAHPPRLLVVRENEATGQEEIMRNQVGCAAFLEAIDIPPLDEDPRAVTELPAMKTLETIGRHMSHLSHWDARPERMVAALEALAIFLKGDDAVTGEVLFSDLCLTSLEIIFERWQSHLRESRDLAALKEPGLTVAIKALEERPVWEVDEVRADMECCIDQRIAADARRSRALHDRVVAIIHGMRED